MWTLSQLAKSILSYVGAHRVSDVAATDYAYHATMMPPLRPITPFAITLDKVNGKPAPTWEYPRGRSTVHQLKAVKRTSPKHLVSLGLERFGLDQVGLDASQSSLRLPGLGSTDFNQQRTSTPDLFNHLSLDKEMKGRWLVDFIEKDVCLLEADAADGGEDDASAGGGGGVGAACTRLVQLLGKGMGGLQDANYDSVLGGLQEQAAECSRRQDFGGGLRAQRTLVVRLAQCHIERGTDEASLREHTPRLAHWCFGIASADNLAESGVTATAEELLDLCESLCADSVRPLWTDDTARRLLRGAVFGQRGRAGFAKGRLHAAQKWLEKALRLLKPLLWSGDSATAERSSGAIADLHLTLCAALSTLGNHEGALQNASAACDAMHYVLGLPGLDGLQAWMDSSGVGGAEAIEEAIASTNEDSEDGVGGAGYAAGRLLIAAYHNCAVQFEALGMGEAALSSIGTAVQLADWLWAVRC